MRPISHSTTQVTHGAKHPEHHERDRQHDIQQNREQPGAALEVARAERFPAVGTAIVVMPAEASAAVSTAAVSTATATVHDRAPFTGGPDSMTPQVGRYRAGLAGSNYQDMITSSVVC